MDTAVKNLYTTSNSEQFIPGTGGGNVRLRALYILPGTGGAFDDDRFLELKDIDSDTTLFKIFIQRGDGGQMADSAFPYHVKIPGAGIRFPSGIKFTPAANFSTSLSIFYEG
tara:strand:+ start:2588 stop:2923 length:336 start_codon:yes stop_codon:yes gene_type:complete